MPDTDDDKKKKKKPELEQSNPVGPRPTGTGHSNFSATEEEPSTKTSEDSSEDSTEKADA